MISASSSRRGFTLMETVIAIGVLAVLLTAFLAVFGPATAGIRRAISAQEADRLASTVEKELGTLHPNEKSAAISTAFEKAFNLIKSSAVPDNTQVPDAVLYVYQYRADPSKMREDGTLAPYVPADNATGTVGVDYVIQSIARPRLVDQAPNPLLAEDLKALEGRVYAVRTVQLVLDANGGLTLGTAGTIKGLNPPNIMVGNARQYPDAALAFRAEFYPIQSTAANYLTGGNGFIQTKLKAPIFTRNLSVLR